MDIYVVYCEKGQQHQPLGGFTTISEAKLAVVELLAAEQDAKEKETHVWQHPAIVWDNYRSPEPFYTIGNPAIIYRVGDGAYIIHCLAVDKSIVQLCEMGRK